MTTFRQPARPFARALDIAPLRSAPVRDHTWAVLCGLVIGGISMVSPVLGLIAVVGVGFAVLALLRPVALGYLMIVVIALTGGAQRDRFIPVLTPNEIGLVLTVGLLVPALFLARRRRNDDVRLVGLAFVILVIGTVAIPVADFSLRRIPLDLDNAFKLVGPIQYFLLFWSFTMLARDEGDKRRLTLFMLSGGTVVALIGLLQAARIGFVVNLLNNYFSSVHVEDSLDAEAGRITSVIGAWNALGMFMMTCIVLAWATLPGMKTVRDRAIVFTSLVVCAVTLIGSGSFSGIFGAALGLLLVSYFTGRIQRMIPLAVGGGLAIAAVLVVGQSFLLPVVQARLEFQFGESGDLVPRTLSTRFDIWRDVFATPIRQHFPRAVHPNVPASYAWLWEESQYVMLLFRTGLAGLAAHLIWVGLIVTWLRRRLRQIDGLNKMYAACALTIMIVMSIGGFTNAVFNYSGSIDYMWILFAFVASSTESGDHGD